MKVAILAGGKGTRLTEETRSKSKAMVRIGEQPILWHLLQYYKSCGFSEAVVALGYQADSIREYFAAGQYDPGEARYPEQQRWLQPGMAVDLVDTGPDTNNGGRVFRLAPYLNGETFMLTWCDGLSNIDLKELRKFHEDHGKIATLSAVHPPARFGRLGLEGDRVYAFDEKQLFPDEWINGAFFVLNPDVFEEIERGGKGDDTSFERDTLHRLALRGELMAYRHEGFWQCMDTLKEAEDLDNLWRSGAAPWKLWK